MSLSRSPELRDGIARQRHVQVVGYFLRRDVESARLRPGHFEVNGALAGSSQFELHVVGIRVLPHHLGNSLCPMANRADLGTGDAENWSGKPTGTAILTRRVMRVSG